MQTIARILILSLLVVGATNVRAEVIPFLATDAGFVTAMGGSAKGDSTVAPPAKYNYSVGQEEHYDDGSLGAPIVYMPRKNYFIFDLTGVTDDIVAAELMVYMGPDLGPDFPAAGGEHGYESLDPFETFVLTETTDPTTALSIAGDLKFGSESLGTSAFDDAADPLVADAKALFGILGDGADPLGIIDTTSADDDTFLTIGFTDPGLAYLNGFKGATLILAGELATIGMPADTATESELIFGFTGPDLDSASPLAPVLIVTTVPEPGGLALLLLGACAAFARRRSLRD